MCRFWNVSALACFLALAPVADGLSTAYRGSVMHFVGDPRTGGDEALDFFEDGLLVVDDGHVVAVGAFEQMARDLAPETTIVDYRGHFIMPGFVDTHVHFPQTEMIAAYGEQLLEWLATYTFPTERKYQDYRYARKQAKFFLDQLMRNGTTTALVFATVHRQSVDALFDEALERRMRLIAGKVMMDRNAPDYLLDTPESSYAESRELIEAWHGKGRLLYAVTPRFAPTSTPAQLSMAGRLKAEYPTVYVHTHLSENRSEVAWVKELFPERSGYLDVYDFFGLTGERSIFAHGIHLTEREVERMAETRSVAAFCPSSNLFLGSGLFRLLPMLDRGIRVGLGTDVGAGTSFSMLETLSDGYKVLQLQGAKLSALEGFYLATLGGAKALSLDDRVGNFAKGKEADFLVIDPRATELLAMRTDNSRSLREKLFVLMTLGDDRTVRATYVDGRIVYEAAK